MLQLHPDYVPIMPLSDVDVIVLNSSGGKDSQAMIDYVADLVYIHQVPPHTPTDPKCRPEVHVVHADLGRMEWPGTKELAKQQADHYELPFHVTARRKADGQEENLLDYVRRRRKWPSSTTRFCTSDFKRGPCARVITQLSRDWLSRHSNRSIVRIVNCFGFRAEESPARAKRAVFTRNERLCTRSRRVYDWLPIHTWTEKQVWDRIKASGVPHHPAYDIGMPRLSCSLCIFAPKGALMIAGKARPDLLQEYVDLEKEIGHDFQNKKPIRLIQEALARGEEPEVIDGAWNM